MNTLRQIAAYIASIAAAVAEMAVTATRLVWKAGRWVVESITPAPRRAAPAGGGSADMAAALAEAATAPVATPAALTATPAPKPDVSLDEAAVEWGKLAKQYALAMGSPDAPEPDLKDLDDAAYGWLCTLGVKELHIIGNADARQVGMHMFGKRDLPGLSICPTQAEYEMAKHIKAEAKRLAASQAAETRQVTQDILQDLVDHPTWEPRAA
ncbi:hypothetical protein B2G69_08150 [Methylorubrum zatmanii]|nr:hypothetical protein [Methylorubrum zatmanii]ARO54120.1 hypothetical protein B2G69_08150 [Methylorubrum zatmanii]